MKDVVEIPRNQYLHLLNLSTVKLSQIKNLSELERKRIESEVDLLVKMVRRQHDKESR